MVFKSAKERVVIRKCVDDKLLPLTKEDIDICMSHSFAYDESWEDDEIEETITHSPVVKKDTVKKSISDAITEANIKASDIDLILCELQIDKKNSSECDDDDEDPEEDLLEEEDD